MIKLSILILTTPRRRAGCFQKLLDSLEAQAEGKPVEIIGLYDNKKRTVGAKRNAALSLVQGEYMAFCDDDDTVAPDYVDAILACLEAHPGVDVVVFDCETTITRGGKVVDRHYSKYGKDFPYTLDGNPDIRGFKQWRGKPSHTMCWRTEVAKKAAFPDKSYAEDVDWVALANKELKTEARIDRPLYFYAFNDSISETRG